MFRSAAPVRQMVAVTPFRLAPVTCRTFFLRRKQPILTSQEFDLQKLRAARRDYDQHRTAFLVAGALSGIIATIYTGWKLKKAIQHKWEKEKAQKGETPPTVKCDSPIPTETFKTEAGERRKVVLHDDQGHEIVPTGNSVVPVFPRIINVAIPPGQHAAGAADGKESLLATTISDQEGVEMTLVGLGMRTVTFIGIQVYLVGFYVATQDIERLQHFLVKKINPLATTLIPSEKDALRRALLDAVDGEQTWNAILQESGCRSAFRITPVRDTDFHHLRDGFVRAIQARSQKDGNAYQDEAFGDAMKQFRALFNRGSVPKTKELILCRDNNGVLSVMYGAGKDKEKRDIMGVIPDERLSRLLWLNYLAGDKVAAEGARRNIIQGVMEFVERPVGTVAAQVV
ncbi:hypothetical protein CDD81_4792 [Ophiocordyceps australis]|uniref:Chalcone isomerase domain-containing protein n=1 Tax=Ophiocordyceps australis TaxID=1399860 RepID=A0A2C5XIX7_9HYPO|nr:hypothetical protein CDD81_4792 [Ophiocordyceps australis]